MQPLTLSPKTGSAQTTSDIQTVNVSVKWQGLRNVRSGLYGSFEFKIPGVQAQYCVNLPYENSPGLRALKITKTLNGEEKQFDCLNMRVDQIRATTFQITYFHIREGNIKTLHPDGRITTNEYAQRNDLDVPFEIPEVIESGEKYQIIFTTGENLERKAKLVKAEKEAYVPRPLTEDQRYVAQRVMMPLGMMMGPKVVELQLRLTPLGVEVKPYNECLADALIEEFGKLTSEKMGILITEFRDSVSKYETARTFVEKGNHEKRGMRAFFEALTSEGMERMCYSCLAKNVVQNPLSDEVKAILTDMTKRCVESYKRHTTVTS